MDIEQEIQAKGLTAPRVTPADIEAAIRSEHYFTAADGVVGTAAEDGHTLGPHPDAAIPALGLLTFCVLVLRNGFTVTGESACASPENFDADLGRKIARQNAVGKVWPLLGFQLRSLLQGKAELDAARTHYPHQQRVLVERHELADRIGKLSAFFDTETFSGLPDGEQERLKRQAAAMGAYMHALNDRIAAFAQKEGA